MGMCSKKAFTILNTRQHALDKNNCKEKWVNNDKSYYYRKISLRHDGTKKRSTLLLLLF